jgi:hypothetical protein
MNETVGGEYKLLFILPVFPDTGRVLLLDIPSRDLENRLSAMGIDCRSGSMEGAAGEDTCGGYDLIVAGRMPAGRKGRSEFSRSVGRLLSPQGRLVIVAPNRFGYSRLTGRKGGTEGSSSLGTMRGMVRKMGFSEVSVFSPVPDTANPSAFISLYGSNSFEFLLAQFPDFISAKSGPVRSLFTLLIRTGIFRHFQNHYAIVAGGREQVQETG